MLRAVVIPLFLFQTCIGSGMAPFLPLDLEFLAEFPNPPVVFATRRGRDPCASEVADELAEGMLTGYVSLGNIYNCFLLNHLCFQ